MFRLGFSIQRHAPKCPFLHIELPTRQRRTAVCPAAKTAVTASRRPRLAMVIPGDSQAEFVFLSGTVTFLNVYQNLLFARIILSWFPAASQLSLLQPLYVVCDPFLRFFQGILPPVAGIDFSPILGFTLLQLGARLTAALGQECPSRDVAKAP
ncbi:hypothetical protein, conserved [Cyanidioschyzon merolae strain 10D]|jgi:YggT family protein|uniref:Uncharacterized protein n=1 Tax=Cyanidioschyzon merolae (strain NIES-3377 / 10D) TaxID=280699 RepID=M1V3W2_CYAM1|nr:hypothetical protein, conserved [Cyanidioschyzon merolae strain 10D]BAM78975.1 hypothetical protein, conserved [Cyanidioschyzon merolae strain 10D]|eukprot:XP_005535261.1 hypothetical protein, conserved [Cyanidioschyzon merolae strain 10D]